MKLYILRTIILLISISAPKWAYGVTCEEILVTQAPTIGLIKSDNGWVLSLKIPKGKEVTAMSVQTQNGSEPLISLTVLDNPKLSERVESFEISDSDMRILEKQLHLNARILRVRIKEDGVVADDLMFRSKTPDLSKFESFEYPSWLEISSVISYPLVLGESHPIVKEVKDQSVALRQLESLSAKLVIKSQEDIDEIVEAFYPVSITDNDHINTRRIFIKNYLSSKYNLSKGKKTLVVDLAEVMTPFFRARLHLSGLNSKANCLDCVINFNSNDPNIMGAYRDKDIRQGDGELVTFPARELSTGDVVTLTNSQGDDIHGFNYVLFNLIFTKDGNDMSMPYRLTYAFDSIEKYYFGAYDIDSYSRYNFMQVRNSEDTKQWFEEIRNANALVENYLQTGDTESPSSIFSAALKLGREDVLSLLVGSASELKFSSESDLINLILLAPGESLAVFYLKLFDVSVIESLNAPEIIKFIANSRNPSNIVNALFAQPVFSSFFESRPEELSELILLTQRMDVYKALKDSGVLNRMQDHERHIFALYVMLNTGTSHISIPSMEGEQSAPYTNRDILIDLLKSDHIDVNYIYNDGASILSRAIRALNVPAVQALLDDEKIALNHKDYGRRGYLELIATIEHPEARKYILKIFLDEPEFNIHQASNSGGSPYEIIKKRADKGDYRAKQVLHIIQRRGMGAQ